MILIVLWSQGWPKPLSDFERGSEKCKSPKQSFKDINFVISCEFCQMVGYAQQPCRYHILEKVKKLWYEERTLDIHRHIFYMLNMSSTAEMTIIPALVLSVFAASLLMAATTAPTLFSSTIVTTVFLSEYDILVVPAPLP